MGERALKKIVLFGAGTSYGASHVLPASPPLGSGLFTAYISYPPPSYEELPRFLVRF